MDHLRQFFFLLGVTDQTGQSRLSRVYFGRNEGFKRNKAEENYCKRFFKRVFNYCVVKEVERRKTERKKEKKNTKLIVKFL